MRLKLSSWSGSSLFLSSLFGVVGLLAASCGGDEPVSGTANTSTPDDTEPDAAGPGESNGGNETGGGNGDDTSSTTSPTPTTSDNTLPDTPAGTAVGIACTDNSDCDSPLTCVRTDDSFRGALPGTGICTMPCTSDSECQAVDLYGFCDLIGAPTDAAIEATAQGDIPEGMAPYCLQACPFGLSAAKCDALPTSACTPIEAAVTETTDGAFQFGLCLPLCSGDDDCEDGERCDPTWGMCVDEVRGGKGLGEKCDPAADAECSGGLCIGISEELPYGLCTAPCNFHPDTIVCGGEPGTDAEFGCFSNLFTELVSTRNDLGQCLPLCDADDDCPDAFACDLSAADTLPEFYGRTGVCFPTEESIAEAVSALGDGGGAMSTEPEPEPSNTDAGGSATADGG